MTAILADINQALKMGLIGGAIGACVGAIIGLVRWHINKGKTSKSDQTTRPNE
jgi:hypothetical protein